MDYQFVKEFNDMFNLFGTIPNRDRRTDRHLTAAYGCHLGGGEILLLSVNKTMLASAHE